MKIYISKVLIKLTTTTPFSIQADYFIELESKLYEISTTDELMGIVDKSLNKIIEIKNNK
ncbi:MAG: hypothetical protein H7Z76_14540 [Methylotenera sp.]|nr:hypothetical protein [Flavobacterium sp.]